MFAMSDIIERIKGLRYVHVPQASQLFEEAIAEIKRLRAEVDRLRERVNEFIDAERKHIMEHDPIRYDMNDPIFSEDAYE